jgi:hypothetical protein
MPVDHTRIQVGITVDQAQVVRLESARLRVDVSPATGGRLTSLFNHALGQEFLWRNAGVPLAPVPAGAPYDPNFYGGLDDVIPGDLPEVIDGLACPDHGEVWNLPLDWQIDGEALLLDGRLPRWGLRFRKRVSLRPDADWVYLDYQIDNLAGQRRVFLWKLHAAAVIAPGDVLDCPAETAVAADAHWSRWGTAAPFAWPLVAGQRADLVPPPDGTTDFLFLYNLRAGRVALRRPAAGRALVIEFDRTVFPYVCVFASYGGFDGHYTAILEPATAMPLSVKEAARLGQCSVLEPGETLRTRVSVYAGSEWPVA